MSYEISFCNTGIILNSYGSIYFRPLIDIYYGVSTKSRVTEKDIITTFFTASGLIGYPRALSIGRLYVFPIAYNYKYWCIPDSSNDGNRVINQVTNGSTNTILAYDSYYQYYQDDPTPIQSITYGKIVINDIVYRIYRTMTKTSENNEQYISSF